MVVNVSQRVEDPEVYNAAISGTDAYDQALVDEALEDQAGNLLRDLEIAELPLLFAVFSLADREV